MVEFEEGKDRGQERKSFQAKVRDTNFQNVFSVIALHSNQSVDQLINGRTY